MKKILVVISTVFLMGCSNNNLYKNIADENYREAVIDSRFLSKVQGNESYYKFNGSEKTYIILRKNNKTNEVTPLLNLEYSGENWIYMEKATFKTESGEVILDFVGERFKNRALVDEDPNVSGSVVEKILIPLTLKNVEDLKALLEGSSDINLHLESRYRNRGSDSKLSEEERKELLVMIKLYMKTRGEK